MLDHTWIKAVNLISLSTKNHQNWSSMLVLKVSKYKPNHPNFKWLNIQVNKSLLKNEMISPTVISVVKDVVFMED